MKKPAIIFLVSFASIIISAQKPAGKSVTGIVTDRIFAFDPGSVKIDGYTGSKIDLVISQRIKKQDADDLVEPFRTKKETHLWQSEFWGKWIHSAIAAYDYNHDPELLAIIHNAVKGLLATQMPYGYIGNYSDNASLQHWDIWGRKYTLLGLLAYYDLTRRQRSSEECHAGWPIICLARLVREK